MMDNRLSYRFLCSKYCVHTYSPLRHALPHWVLKYMCTWLIHLSLNAISSAETRGVYLSMVAQSVKNPPAIRETWVWSLGWEDLLEKGMATHSSMLAWKIPWTDEPGRLQSMGSQRVGHDWATFTFTFSYYSLSSFTNDWKSIHSANIYWVTADIARHRDTVRDKTGSLSSKTHKITGLLINIKYLRVQGQNSISLAKVT